MLMEYTKYIFELIGIIFQNYQHVRPAPVNDRGIVKELRNSRWYNYKDEELINKIYEIRSNFV